MVEDDAPSLPDMSTASRTLRVAAMADQASHRVGVTAAMAEEVTSWRLVWPPVVVEFVLPDAALFGVDAMMQLLAIKDLFRRASNVDSQLLIKESDNVI